MTATVGTIQKRKQGRPRVADAAKVVRGSPQVRNLRRHAPVVVRPQLGRATRLSDSQIERICRTMIPGYSAWDTARPGDRFDVEAARASIDYFGSQLTHVKGAKARTPFYLRRWQMAVIGNLFGWKQENGKRRYRTTFFFVPRKNGKSPLAAGIILYLLNEDNEAGAEIYGAASEYQQASLVFYHARGMTTQNEELCERAKIYSGQQKAIQLGEETGYSTYRVVSSEAFSAHGWNTHCGLVDELHTQPNRDLVDALETSTGARAQPLIIYLTTSDYDRESICNEKQDYAEKVRDGIIDDPTFLPVLYVTSIDDDWEDRAIWRKANPNLGVSVSMEYLESAFRKAKETPSFENTFRRLHLNQRTQQDVRWLSLADWDACAGSVNEAELLGAPCYCGLDLSTTTDISALSMTFRVDEGWKTFWRFWIPGDSAIERERKDRVPYPLWIKEGWIKQTRGNVVDYDVIRADINELAQKYHILQLAIDRWNSTQLQTQLMGDGIEIVQYGQGFPSMTAPTKELEKLVKARAIEHGANPVARWMASNVTVEMDAAGNLKPSKAKSTEKIDGMVSLIMSLGIGMTGEPESVYEERGLIVL